MSWISGYIILKNTSEKELLKAKEYIRQRVRENADLEEFPNMGNRLNPIKVKELTELPCSFEEAEEKADEYSWNRNYSIVIPFLDVQKVKETSKMKKIKERIEAEEKKYEEYAAKHSVLTFKAAYISCPMCGSKLNREYLKNDMCPICRADMRSDTTQKTLARYTERIRELKNERKKLNREEEKKVSANDQKRYVLFYEEYVG